MIPQIPYAAIGLGTSVLLGIWAFLVAETDRERVLIGAALAVLLFLRVLWRGPTGNVVSLVCWMVFGICCLLFLRWRGVRIR
jgi:hypothetical protein